MNKIEKWKSLFLEQVDKKTKSFLWKHREKIYEHDLYQWLEYKKEVYLKEQQRKFWKNEGKSTAQFFTDVINKKIDMETMNEICKTKRVCSPFVDEAEKLREAEILLKSKLSK